jgi:sarcosine oxidase
MTKHSKPAADSIEPAPPSTTENAPADGGVADSLPRREFLRVAGGSAGLFMAGAAGLPLRADAPSVKATLKARATGRSSDIVVIGAGGWGSFTALNLVQRGHKVTLVDAYGPGNARATSGDESRGVRSSYGDRPGVQGEVWTLWAREAMKKWVAFDDEWGKHFRLDLFHVTGDLIMRSEWDNFQLRTKVWWDKHKIPYEILNPADVRKSFPVISIDDITAILYEPDAGVVRARRAAQAAASAFEALGGKIVIGRAVPPTPNPTGRVESLALDTGETLRADTFVFCVGPWMAKTFPELLAKKTRAPMGYVCYFGTPVNDERFTYPNLPSFNFPGVTGWAALPVDNRGFRVRGTERAPGAPTGRGGVGAGVQPGTQPGGAGACAGGGGGGGGRGGQGGFGQQADVPPAQLDPDLSDRWADAARVEGSRRFIAHRFPLLKDAPISETHSCHYESTSSGNYIIDKHPQLSNAWIVAGGNAEGFKMCPVIGEYAANRITGIDGDPVLVKAFKIPIKEFEPPPPPPSPKPATPADSAKRPPEDDGE